MPECLSPMGSAASAGVGTNAGTRGWTGWVMSSCRVPAPAADGRSRSNDLSFSESPLPAKYRYPYRTHIAVTMSTTRPMTEMFFQDMFSGCRRATLGIPASPSRGLMVLPLSGGNR